MDENDTSNELIALQRQRSVSLVARVAPAAAFVCQLIAERDHLPPQRLKRRETPGVAKGVYDAGSHIADRRMPAGYRTARVV
jgi:hypothetical protein